jgi:crossover junction endodeoxyribonuclease RuvC
MRILGIDPGSVATGWGVVASARGSGSLEHVAHGTLRVPRALSLPARLAHIHRGLLEVIEDLVPEEAAIERVFLARNPNSALVLGQARGAAMAALGAAGLDVEEVAAREVKQSVVGSGAASKAQIQLVVAKLLGLPSPPPVDAADALAVAICAAHRGRLTKVGVRRRSSRAASSRRARASSWAARRIP